MFQVLHLFFIVFVISPFTKVYGQHYNRHLVVPRFTVVPDRRSYYNRNADSSLKLQLLCASWPPNSYLNLVDPKSYSIGEENSLTRQKFALLRDGKWDLGTVSYSSVDDALQNFTSSVSSDIMISRSTTNSMGMQISVENQSRYGGFKSNEAELHCLTKTNLGGMLSPPFLISEASLGKYPSEYEIQRSIEDDEFLINNIAFFDCHLPMNSKPDPIVKFKKNNMDLYINPEKHMTIKSSDGSNVTLLISRFDKSDEGIYECSIENPLTGEKIISPIKKKLKVHESLDVVDSKIRRPIVGNNAKKITVRKGQNLTLFCVIESAPVPDTTTAPYNSNDKGSRFKYHHKFGAFEIVNIQESDDNKLIVCTDRKLSSIVRIEVLKKLELVKYPKDQVIRKFEETVTLDCETSNKSIVPEWYFNGVPIQSGSGGQLKIPNVQRHHLGIYQCVAKTFGPNGEIDEWVSESAIISHESQRLIKTPEELADLIPKNMTESSLPMPSITTPELTPETLVVSDNLFAFINWTAPENILESALDMKNQKMTIDKKLTSQNVYNRVKFVLEMITQQNSGPWPSALNGLMGSKQMLWTDPRVIQDFTIKQAPNNSYFYVYLNNKILKPGSKYRFRVKTLSVETELDILPVSNWSNTLSFGHITSVAPPIINSIKPLSEGRIFLEWTFNPERNITNESFESNHNDTYFMETGSLGSPSSSNEQLNVFVPDLFRILARPIVKPKSKGIFSFASSNSEQVVYGKYKSFDIRGSDTRQATISGLNQSENYQVLIYALSGDGDNKQITLFSDAQYANLDNRDIMKSNSMWDFLSNNKLMYIILASLAGFMVIVMCILVIICCCRQKKSRKHRNKTNSYPFGYKDDKNFSQNNMDRMDARLMGSNGHTNGTNTLMKMNSMDKYAQQQQAAEEYAMTIAQAQAMQQKQQQQQQAAMLLGSSLHLAQSPQQQNSHHLNSNNLPHHQSHQSLHMNSMMMNSNGNHRISTIGPNNYHSGTLPINSMAAQNRYLMRQSSMNNGIIDQNGVPPPLPPPSQQMMYMPMGSSTLNRGMQMNHMTSNGNLNTSHYGTTNAHRNKGEYGDLNALNSSQMNNSQFEGMIQQQNQMSMMQQNQQNYFHGSQQHLAGQMATYGPGSLAMGSVIGGSSGQNAQSMSMHRPFMNGNTNDGDSIYSYFTQQQQQQQQQFHQGLHSHLHHQNMNDGSGMMMGMGTPGSMHPHLNPLPEEANGYNENGQAQYSDNNTLNNSITGSPAQPNGHKHHRRRKRKTQQQQQQQMPGQHQQSQLNTMNLIHNNSNNSNEDTNDNSGGHIDQSFNQYSLDNSNGHHHNNDQANYQADPTATTFNNMMNSSRMTSHQNYPPPPPIISQSQQPLPPPQNCQSPLPPPNQPPPPPPAFSQRTPQHQTSGNSQSPQNVFQNLPRIRDYSEYGIPKNI